MHICNEWVTRDNCYEVWEIGYECHANSYTRSMGHVKNCEYITDLLNKVTLP